jgi:hypothetical protein
MDIKKYEELTCSQCGKSAAWNTPCMDSKGNVWCDTCAKNSKGVFLMGIDQHLRDDKFFQLETHAIHYCMNNCCISIHMERPGVRPSVAVWYEGGSRSYPLDDKEYNKALFDPLSFLTKLSKEVAKGYRWCTKCGKKMTKEEVAGYPLFAGVACSKCWEAHKEHLTDQKKKGHVCSMCNQPYDNCCC